jgi:hypothetical protein
VPDEPHMALAGLPLPLYITTNYDDFMYEALKKTGGKEPQFFINRWNGGAIAASDINPTESKPVVYLDVLVRISRDQTLIPPRIQHAIGGTSLLFIGYSLNDTNFRVIFRGLVESQRSTRKISVTVQIDPGEPKVVEYLTKYFASSGIRVYWGTARDFVAELKKRWDEAPK